MLFINILILFAQSYMLIKKIISFKKNYMDISSIFYLIYYFFYIPVFWDMFLENSIFKYVYKIVAEYNIFASKSTLTFFNFMSFLIMIGFDIGFCLNKKKNIKSSCYKFLRNNYIFIQGILIIVWSIIFFSLIRKYGGNFFSFVMPSSKDLYSSSLIKYFYIAISMLIFTLKCCKDIYMHGKIRKNVIFNILIIALTVFPPGQRREIVECFIYVSLILVFSGDNFKKLVSISSNETFKKMIKIFLLCLIFVVLFWYARVYFTQVQKNKKSIDNPLYVRNPIEIVYGSGATGFPTNLALNNFYIDRQFPYFRNIVYVFTNIVPRSIYHNKMYSMTEYIQQQVNANSNLSLFYISDMYFTFGIFAPIASLLFGLFLSYFYNKGSGNDIREKYIGYFMLSKIILLFKNGFSEYLFLMIFYMFIFEICIRLVFPKDKKVNI